MKTYLRFRDLKKRGTVKSWPQLRNMIEKYGFPAGKKFGPNTRVFDEHEVEMWENARPVETKPGPIVNPRGRPRKVALSGAEAS
jgi:hypothetical protein